MLTVPRRARRRPRRRRLAAATAAAGILAVATLTGCFPHSTATLNICATMGWDSRPCSQSLCVDWVQNHYNTSGEWSYCDPAIRFGTGPR